MNEVTIFTPSIQLDDFLFRLFLMLQKHNKNNEMVEWSQSMVVVHDPVRFENELLYKYFKRTKLSDFLNKMDCYGFRNERGESNTGSYSFTHDETSQDLASILQLRVSFLHRRTIPCWTMMMTD